MPAISGPRSAPVVTSTSSTQPKAATQPQQSAPAAEGYGSNSSFATAASAPASNPPKAITDAKAQLERFPAGADRDAVALVFNKPFPTPKELKAASDALGRLGDSAPEGMTEADYKKLANGLGYKQNQNTMMSMVTSNLQKMIEEIKKRGEKKD